MIFYKMDVEEELRKHGYNSYRLKKDNLLPTTTLTRIKNGENITMNTLNSLCVMLRCQPSDIIGFQITDEEKIRFF